MQLDERTLHRYLIFGIILVHFMGLFVDVIENEASQYASIAREMLQDGHWLQVQHRHTPYLDKPPLLFWFSAISFKLLGISNFAYKLPSFLFALLAMFSTFKLTQIYYGQRAGRMASIILGSLQALYMTTMDVHTDSLLLGAVIFSIWQLVEYNKNQRFKHLFWGSIGLALVLLARGPIGLLVPTMAIGADLILRKQWNAIFKWQWLISLTIMMLLLIPMSYGLYEQFDKNPERLVHGKKAVSGLLFYFWDSGIGAFSVEHLLKKGSSLFLFVQTTLWAFSPWTLVLILALLDRFRFFRKETKYPEYLSLAGIVLPFLIFTLLKDPFPQNVFVVYPLCAMLSGAYLDKIAKKTYHLLHHGQLFLLFLLWILAFMLLFYIFTPTNIIIAMVALAIFGIMWWGLMKLPKRQVLVLTTALTALGINMVLIGHTYPKVLKYQSSTKLGHWLKNNPEMGKNFASFKIHQHALDFYGRNIFPIRNTVNELTQNDTYLYTDEEGLLALKKAKIHFVKMQIFEDFAESRLTLPFLDPNQRSQTISKRYLIAIYPKK